jgi:hypothetical protein
VAVATYNASGSEQYLGVTYAGTVLINLAAGVSNKILIIKDERGTASTQNILVVPNGADTIDGQSTYTISTNYGFTTLWFSSGWRRIG